MKNKETKGARKMELVPVKFVDVDEDGNVSVIEGLTIKKRKTRSNEITPAELERLGDFLAARGERLVIR